MQQRMTVSRLANLGAEKIYSGFQSYHQQFVAVTRRAAERFIRRDLEGIRADAKKRLDLYQQWVDQIEADIRELLQDRLNEALVWASMKAVYSGRIVTRTDWELAETFFNSITRRIFTTVGVDPSVEFADTDFDSPPFPPDNPIYRTFDVEIDLLHTVATILHELPFQAALHDLQSDARRIAGKIGAILAPVSQLRFEFLEPIFYHEKGAYKIGRISGSRGYTPIVIALQHDSDGIYVDALLLDESSLSILFSFTRSYFHVLADCPHDLVQFIKSILPRKPIAEIYNAIGYNKHGKTELYRSILYHTATCGTEQFQIARGKPGLVMVVFSMPNDELVFKLIRDHFHNPKSTTRQAVKKQYDYVFRHHRAGRLVEAQSFEYLEFDRCWFSDELLEELRSETLRTVHIGKDSVVMRLAYVQRCVTPLDIYLQEADDAAARDVVLDYGRAIKDLAMSNIFPGDMLLKNFGVTRHKRVVFYDFDELCPLVNCNFRKMPPARDDMDELSAEPWFFVGENDVFPEEFESFLGLPDKLHQTFRSYHADLFDATFWQQTQKRIASELPVSILPYGLSRKLDPDRHDTSN